MKVDIKGIVSVGADKRKFRDTEKCGNTLEILKITSNPLTMR